MAIPTKYSASPAAQVYTASSIVADGFVPVHCTFNERNTLNRSILRMTDFAPIVPVRIINPNVSADNRAPALRFQAVWIREYRIRLPDERG